MFDSPRLEPWYQGSLLESEYVIAPLKPDMTANDISDRAPLPLDDVLETLLLFVFDASDVLLRPHYLAF